MKIAFFRNFTNSTCQTYFETKRPSRYFRLLHRILRFRLCMLYHFSDRFWIPYPITYYLFFFDFLLKIQVLKDLDWGGSFRFGHPLFGLFKFRSSRFNHRIKSSFILKFARFLLLQKWTHLIFFRRKIIKNRTVTFS